MKFVPVVNCPSCGMPYTSAQIGHPFTTGVKYTTTCFTKDIHDKKVGCGACFDYEIVEVKDFEDRVIPKTGMIAKLLGKTETQAIQVGTHLEVRAKIRGS